MSFREMKFRDFIAIQRGHDLPESERTFGIYPVVGSAGINGYHHIYKANSPGVTIGRSGASIAKAFFIDKPFWPHNACLYVKDFKGNNEKFVYYFLKANDFSNLNSGSAQPSLNRNILYGVKVKIPIRYIQDKIASILSAYDDLIENNNQRIKLLEDMAEEIYKEWFVRFRFPGYEDTKFFDKDGKEVPHGTKGAIPEGWEKVRLDKFIDFEKGVEPGSKNYESEPLDDNYVPFLRVGDLGSRDSNIFIKKGLSKDKYVRKDDILITLDGTVGKVAMGLEGCYSSGLRKIVYKTDLIKRSFAYFTLLSANIQGTIQAHAAGTTILHASGSTKFMKIALPIESLLKKFESITDSMLDETLILKDKNQILQDTRDLLLPRLISGKLSVEDLQLEENQLNMAAEPRENYNN
ncbi:restriction endonuclease subunit S [Psychroflexus sp. CAK1W]|uniref:restriction endonuclease subunit S n=1 Tax=Psychroflexus curvus TaxID=2873595 RepID=UPI001CCBA779|nr:restriction endonuclease subunit S [Psychroflexus curvus]MBZ9628162.1 restriction endonuclease subunit S [Psychroflexus curvus]